MDTLSWFAFPLTSSWTPTARGSEEKRFGASKEEVGIGEERSEETGDPPGHENHLSKSFQAPCWEDLAC